MDFQKIPDAQKSLLRTLYASRCNPYMNKGSKNTSSWSVTSLSFNGGSPRILEVETKKAIKRDPFLLSKKWIVFPMIIMFQGARFCCEFVWQVEGLPLRNPLLPRIRTCSPRACHAQAMCQYFRPAWDGQSKHTGRSCARKHRYPTALCWLV